MDNFLSGYECKLLLCIFVYLFVKIELQASFSNGSLKYHVIGKFTFPENDKYAIRELARKASQTEDERSEEDVVIPLRIVTK